MSDVREEALLVEERDDGVVLVTMNRPAAKNTVSFEMWERFAALLDRLERSSPARALVLCGAGGHFGNGGDIKLPPARGTGALRLAARLEMGQRIVARLRALPIPTIAAVEGGAWGVSWSLALACDMILAAADAKFGAPFLDYGLVPDGGAAWFLTRQLGRQRAADLIFSGRTVEVEEALHLGLVARLVEPGTAVTEALRLGATIGDGNVHAVELAKRLLHLGETGDLAATHALELAYCHICQTDDEVPRARERFVQRAAARKAAKAGS